MSWSGGDAVLVMPLSVQNANDKTYITPKILISRRRYVPEAASWSVRTARLLKSTTS